MFEGKFWRVSAVIFIVLLAFSATLNIISVFDRRRLHTLSETNANLIAELQKVQKQNREMLNARAEIQQTLINAAIENRRLSAREIEYIHARYEAAEYDTERFK
jgi:hypothetical protein